MLPCRTKIRYVVPQFDPGRAAGRKRTNIQA
jgi:hypothetical protein